MSGKRAKALRKEVYGEEYSPRFRQYTYKKNNNALLADDRRRRYQQLKRLL